MDMYCPVTRQPSKDCPHPCCTPAENERPLFDRLLSGTIASCSCMVKTPDHTYHHPLCHTRLLMEAAHEISRSPGGASERQPDGYAYRYPDGCIRFSGGREINGSDPVESIPYYFRRAPEPGDKARLMEYAVAAGDCIVAGVPQWRDGWAIISRVQTAPPNERWMLHDADEREKESRAEAEQLALVNTGMDFAVVPIKWRTPTKDEKHD